MERGRAGPVPAVHAVDRAADLIEAFASQFRFTGANPAIHLLGAPRAHDGAGHTPANWYSKLRRLRP